MIWVSLLLGCAVKPAVKLSADAREQAWQAHASRLMAIEAWRLNGRVAISSADDSWTAGLSWQESQASQEVRVVAPLGQGTAILKRSAGGSELHLSSGEVFMGTNASDLLHEQLGWYLPVESLAYWIKGAPDPRYVAKWKLNEQGEVAFIEQGGWQVEYKAYRFSDVYDLDLPAKLYLRRADWRVKLVVQDWEVFK